MKKLLLITGSFIFLALSSQGQLTNTDFLMELAPEHIQERMENAKLANLAYSMDKNDSYDTPMTIEYYTVDIANIETLTFVYEFTYTPAGRLLYMTTMDAGMNNLDRTTYNYTYFGEISSMINQTWSGWGWDFVDRSVYNYTGSEHLSEVFYENWDNMNWEWVFDYGNKFEYVGGEVAPSLLVATSSEDNITWVNDLKMYFEYGTGSTPELVDIYYYDDNFLTWLPGDKWEISDWGPNAFEPDFLFNPHEGMNKITDNAIGKENDFRIYPSNFIYNSSYDQTLGEYTYKTKVESEFDGNNRTLFSINDFNGTSFDSTLRYVVTYDDCYGLEKQISESYVSPGVWSISQGFHFDGTKVPYSTTCYVNAYDYYYDFTDAQPNGIRTKRWVINQATELSVDDLDPFASLNVYPNPAANELTVSRAGDLASNATITIMGLDGKIIKVINWEVAEQKMDISTLPSGIYILQMEMNDDFTVRKFVKE